MLKKVNSTSSVSRASRFTVIIAAMAVATIVVMTALLLWQLRVQELRHAEAGDDWLSGVPPTPTFIRKQYSGRIHFGLGSSSLIGVSRKTENKAR